MHRLVWEDQGIIRGTAFGTPLSPNSDQQVEQLSTHFPFLTVLLTNFPTKCYASSYPLVLIIPLIWTEVLYPDNLRVHLHMC